MHASHPYPIFLSVARRHCLIVGLGRVGSRKLAGLLAAGVNSVLCLDPRSRLELESSGPPGLAESLADHRTRLERRPAAAEDVAASFLVFAATSDPAENVRVMALGHAANVLCASATDPDSGDFIVPAQASAGDLRAAISTGGQSPLLAARFARELRAWLLPRERLAALLGALRPLILSLNWPQARNAALFREIADSPLASWLANGDIDSCLCWLKERLPESANLALEEICANLAAPRQQ